MTMQSSEGNSLRDQNPSFEKQNIPTNNPELLGLKNEFKGTKLEGSPEDSAMYEANFDLFSGVPSQGMDSDFGTFEVPTQTDMTSRSNIVLASVEDQDSAEEFLFNELISNGVTEDKISNMTFAEGLALYKKINASKVEKLSKVAANITEVTFAEEDLDNTAMYAAEDDEAKDDEDDEDMPPGRKEEDAGWKAMAQTEVYRSRLKTAYGVSTKLCLAGLISADEVEANVDLWLNDGLSVKAMLASGAQMLRLSQTAEQRVASAHAEKNLRTAGVSNIPAFSGSSNNVSTDLQQALKSIFSKPELDN